GKLEIVLFGKKLRGEWHLVRTRRDKNEWLLFKAKDRYARNEKDPVPTFDLSQAQAAPFPHRVAPMKVGKPSPPFSDPGWLFEMKFRGRRVLAARKGGTVRLLTEEGENLAAAAADVVRELDQIRAENALIDGVLVALDDAGRPSAEDLQRIVQRQGKEAEPLYFYAFDLLYYEEWDVRDLPLLERKSVLAAVLPHLLHVLYVDHVRGRGEEFLDVTCAAGLPAVVAKEAGSSYASGPSPRWREIPVPRVEASPEQNVLDALKQAAPRPSRRKIKLSNLDKVFWPKEGITKGDLLAYYEQVAELLLPYLHERPTHMLRYPDGIEGKSFYQKDAPEPIPDWMTTERIASEHRGEPIRYIICNDRSTLIYMVNLGSIDLHPWLSRRKSLDSPDWAVFDLDPDDSPFPHVVKIARALGKVLRGIGLRPYLKTSGATGLHIYVPLRPGYRYQQSRTFCEAVARFVAHEHQDTATVERVVSRRRGKVYIDFLQNRRGQTIVPPYVPRPVPGASVSAPLDWDELDSELHLSRWT
ncbi:MAG: non-homologous end-joining DNA ligase, partial [Acidobacteriota bacterium]